MDAILISALMGLSAAHGDADVHIDLAVCKAAPSQEGYDLPMHIASVFIILVFSALGAFGALILSRRSHTHSGEKSRNMTRFCIDLGKHFGTGVILATGFIHMLPVAVESLTNPCVGEFAEMYGSWGTLIVMIAALSMQLIEFMTGEHFRRVESIKTKGGDALVAPNTETCEEESVVVIQVDGHCEVEERAGVPLHHHTGHHCHDPAILHLDGTASRSMRISTYLLEFGIATHSILIGLALGVSPSPEFIPLLIALVFHQFFEGVALGARIADLSYSSKQALKAFGMAGGFVITTPLGIMIGILIREYYTATNASALIVQGVFDAISAGVLIYMAFVHLLAAEITNNANFHRLKGWEKAASFASVWLGAGVMALLGKWA